MYIYTQKGNNTKNNEIMKRVRNLTLCIGIITVFLCACSGGGQRTISGLNPADFDTIINNKAVKLFTLTNESGMEACITNYGGRLVSLCVPNKAGQLTDVVLGFDNIHQYADTVNTPSDFGASIGRYANRINKGQLKVGGKTIQLPTNNFGHCLHGGPSGWQYQVYDAVQPNDSTLQLSIVSPDGDNNFPGTVTAKVIYTLTSDNVLDIKYEATTDRETVINMTNHSYFNLTGDMSQAGTNMVLYINADNYTPIDSTFIPNGKVKSVYGTPLDFTKRHALYETIGDTSFEQIKYARGYDHNWCLNTYTKGKGNDKIVAASLYAPIQEFVLKCSLLSLAYKYIRAISLMVKSKESMALLIPSMRRYAWKARNTPIRRTILISHLHISNLARHTLAIQHTDLESNSVPTDIMRTI